MSKLIDKFQVCFTYLNKLAINRLNAASDTTEKGADYMPNFRRNFKVILKMYWDHLNNSIQDEYRKVISNNDL